MGIAKIVPDLIVNIYTGGFEQAMARNFSKPKNKKRSVALNDAVLKANLCFDRLKYDVHVLMWELALLESSNLVVSELIYPRFQGDDAYQSLRSSLTGSVVATISRLFDSPLKDGKFNKRDIASIKTMMWLLKRKSCVGRILRDIPDDIPGHPDQSSHDNRRFVLGCARRRFGAAMKHKGWRANKRVKEFRDNSLSHSFTKERPTIAVKYDDLKFLTNLAMNALKDMTFFFDGDIIDPQLDYNEYYASGLAFWRNGIANLRLD